MANLSTVNNSAALSTNFSTNSSDKDSVSSFSTDDTHSTASAKDEASESAGEEMLVNGANKIVINFCNMFVRGFGGVKLGELNDTSGVSGEKVAIFAAAAHTIDFTDDPSTMSDVHAVKDFYVQMIILVALVLAIFLVFQQVRPHEAARVVEMVTGKYSYIHSNDLAEYFAITGFWLLVGPIEFYFALWLNNTIVKSMMLSVLDMVSFNSDNAMLYVIMVVLWLILVFAVALRIVSLIIMVRVWFMFGLVLAVKKFRWLGVLIVAYVNGIIFYQAVIVWIAVTIVTYVHTHDAGGLSQIVLYIGMFLMEITVSVVIYIWPLIMAILAPKTWKTIITVARFAI